MRNKKITIIFTIILLFCRAITAQNPTLVHGMDAVVTFQGTVNGTNPGTVAKVEIVGDQSAAPHGTNWVPPVKLPAITTWTESNMGQVFGIAIDDAGNVYFAATAMYWNWDPQRLADPTPAVSGAGGNGYNPLGGPAGIYKADALNLNNVTVLTGTVPASGGVGKTIPNTGYGLGNIAYAKVINKLYASNLEDGKLYCIDPATGSITDTYDPFLPDGGSAQIADYGERIFGLAVNYETTGTRLYYAVLMSDHQSVIWSVQLNNATGAFIPATNSIEINLPASSARTFVSDLAFSMRGDLLVAEKGSPHLSSVYQYFGRHNAWSHSQQLYVASYNGGAGPGHNSAGGVDYGYSKKATTKTEFYCDTIIWTQSNAIVDTTGMWGAYGLLSHPLNDYVNPANFLHEAYMVNLRGSVPANGLTPKGSFGDVECFDWECQANQTDICSKVNARLVQSPVGNCCYQVQVSNKYRADYFTGISITSPGLAIDNVTKDPGCNWANVTFQSPTRVVFTKRIFLNGMPLDTLGAYQTLGSICFTGSGADNITIDFIGNAPQNDTVCRKSIKINGCNIPVDTTCISMLDLKAECVDGAVKMKFKIRNNSAFTMRGITLYSQNHDVVPSPKFIPITDLLPGQTSSVYYETTLIASNHASNVCFFFAACDQNTTPGIAGPYPSWCCMDSIRYCVDIPLCDACTSIAITATKSDPTKCCYNLGLSNNYFNSNITSLEFTGIGGTQFAIFSGWNIIAPVGSSFVKIKAPGTGISPGSYPDFASFCLTGTSSAPHIVLVNIIDANGLRLCTDTLRFEGCQLVTPSCANIVNDSLYCSGKSIRYSFYVKNNAPFPLYQIDFRTTDKSVKLDINHIQPAIPIAKGATGGPFTVSIDSMDANLDRFCMYLSAHNGIYDSVSGQAATECCTDSMGVVCLPMIKCGGCDTTTCCQFENMIIPNGITPNEDGKNDVFEILNSSCCKHVSIKVYNRWGNIVFQNSDYLNDWKGTNDSGSKLAQGTYYVLLELPTGNKKGFYVDIRY